jgi:hypothetical protein
VELSVIPSAATLDSAVRNQGGRRSNEPSPLWSLPLAQADTGPTAVLVEELDAGGFQRSADHLPHPATYVCLDFWRQCVHNAFNRAALPTRPALQFIFMADPFERPS